MNRYALKWLTLIMALIVMGAYVKADTEKKPITFELPAMDGTTYKLEENLGKKVIVLDFWATWCKPCLREMPHVNALYEKYKDRNLQVLAVSIDTAASKSQIKPTVNRYKFTFPVLLDTDNNVIRHYSPNRNVPHLVIIGAKGTIVREFCGYKPGDEKLIETIVQEELEKLNIEE
ncbi:MAG: TlpA disulfide reductase family protein [bacterium]